MFRSKINLDLLAIFSPVGGVMTLKVLDQHLVHSVGGRGVAAGVAHGATASVQVLPHHHGHFPNT
jgi:alanine dehydrogenase